MAEVLGEDCIRTARATGLPERRIIWRHALTAASIPLLTIVGLQIGCLMAGAVVTEYVLNWPGLCLLLVDAVRGRDFPIIQTAVVTSAFIFMSVNLMVDIIYSFVDPRIRLQN